MAFVHSDDIDTAPIAAPEFVVILAEITTLPGAQPMLTAEAFRVEDRAVEYALGLYDLERRAHGDVFLEAQDRVADRDRWERHLRRGRPVYLTCDRVLRLRKLAIKE